MSNQGMGVRGLEKESLADSFLRRHAAGTQYCMAELPEKKDNALDVQVGGGHYKDMVIQVVEFCQKNKLNYCESNMVKYACRHRAKNGKEDLLKIKHYVDLLIEMEYPEGSV